MAVAGRDAQLGADFIRLEPQELAHHENPAGVLGEMIKTSLEHQPELAAAHRAAGLATDDGGFIRVGPTLQSVSHPNIFAAGDVASHPDALRKSGVYAVRAGPVLSENLRLAAGGGTPRPWQPQRRALYLVSMGNQYAMATWGRWSWSGRRVWRWKDRIDRGFISRFSSDIAT